MPIIAEDLGEIDHSVVQLRDKFGFPGMKILQFAFENPNENNFLPHNHVRNCVCYTGTHDNDTTLGWYKNCFNLLENKDSNEHIFVICGDKTQEIKQRQRRLSKNFRK